MAFNAANKVPGVYIDEIDVPGPIAGVATSILAIVGPAREGPINAPTLVTNPTQFHDRFGGHFTAPVFYASHAVMGFFENGGASCYFVRAGTAVRASWDLSDGANTTIVVTALEEGTRANDFEVEVQAAQIAATEAQRGAASLAGGGALNNTAEVDDHTQFRPGDVVLIDEGGADATAEIASIDTTTSILTLTANLGAPIAAGQPIRVANLAPGTTSFRVADSTGIEPGSYVAISQGGPAEELVVGAVDVINHVITLESGLANPYTMAAADAAVDVQTLEFTLVVTDTAALNPLPDETFSNLAMDPRHSRYFGAVVAAQGSAMVSVAPADDPPNPSVPPANVPDVAAAAGPTTNGVADDPTSLGLAEYGPAIDSLERVDAVTMLALPDDTSLAVQGAMITHCETMQDRFAILDPRVGADPTDPAGILGQRGDLNSDRGYAALYYPRICINNPDPNVDGTMLVPPSGHIAGVFARTDDSKGVHKAPANEQMRGVLDLERTLNETEAGMLNENSVNVLRRRPNRGFRIWGARTLTTSTQWRYVNVRRLLLFIEESIQEGTEFAVFEPNNQALWETVKRQVTAFLTTVWNTGAFVGITPDASFKVRVDEELNPPNQIALGLLTFEVTVYPAPPAEFIVFRVIQQPGGPTIEE
ncbi:MAG: phage tail sheath subtilisin-like domain-containing protein [Thermoanaerobaculia bacterium]